MPLRASGCGSDLPAADISGFAERLLAVIDEGRRTATYKLAVLLALMDSCAEMATERGEPPPEIPTRGIARRVASLYWPQLRPFPTGDGTVRDLRQINNKNATILTVLRRVFADLPSMTSWRGVEVKLEASDPRRLEETLDLVELTVARYPLARLQTVDGVAQPFIYDIGWGEGVSIAHLRAGACVVMRPGAGDQLIRLAPLVRPLVELHWARMVANLNKLTLHEDSVRSHLFGADRTPFPSALRRGLATLQAGRCFYCSGTMASATAVDHFVPWARWPNDAIENLVLAHRSCNLRKSDRLPGRGPLERWAHRLRTREPELAEVAERAHWPTDRLRTISLVRSLYAHLPPGAPVWEGPATVAVADPAEFLAVVRNL